MFDHRQNSYTALYLLSESHLSIHTYPEHNFIALDIYTCGNANTKKFLTLISNNIYNYNYKYGYMPNRDINIKYFTRGDKNDIGFINPSDHRSTYYNSKYINILYQNQSEYQYIEIIDHPYLGKTLFINKILQYSEKFGEYYTQMIIKPIKTYDKKNKNILIIGGGNGFTHSGLAKAIRCMV